MRYKNKKNKNTEKEKIAAILSEENINKQTKVEPAVSTYSRAKEEKATVSTLGRRGRNNGVKATASVLARRTKKRLEKKQEASCSQQENKDKEQNEIIL